MQNVKKIDVFFDQHMGLSHKFSVSMLLMNQNMFQYFAMKTNSRFDESIEQGLHNHHLNMNATPKTSIKLLHRVELQMAKL